MRKAIAPVLFLFILSSGFLFVFHDRSEEGIYGTRISELPASMQPMMQSVFSYLDGEGDISFMSKAEQDHLQDVRNVLVGVRVVFVLSSILMVLAFFMKREMFLGAIKPSVIGVFVFLAIIGIGSLFGFAQLWTGFHHVFFPQGNWMFSEQSVLITLFPLEFFMAYAREVVVSILAIALIVLCYKFFAQKV